MTINKTQRRSYGTVLPIPKKTFPTYQKQQTSPQTQQDGIVQTFKDSLVGGFGAGIGMNIADRAISSIFGGRKVQIEHVDSSCEDILNIYKKALSNGENIPQSLQEKYNKCINIETL
jgi:hypothetical protein